MKRISVFLIEIVVIFVLFVGAVNANSQQVQTEKQKSQTEKVEPNNKKEANSNNCPVPCKKVCSKDPDTCRKVKRALNSEDATKSAETKKK